MAIVVYVGTNAHYAPYIEFGTGKYSSTGGGTQKESWFYRDEFGVGHIAYPQKPRPYLKPAIEDHAQEYWSDLADSLRNA